MLRLGLVDFDSSHAVEFTRRFNHIGVPADQWVDGARVVAGCPGSSSMAPERIERFTPQVAACGVELVDRPEDLIGRIDAVLILSLCGSAHRERVEPFLRAGLPAFVDKPFACSWDDAESMVRLAEQHGVMLWSSSALRFAEEVAAVAAHRDRWGEVHGVVCFGPGWRAEGNPGPFHYAIHAFEMGCTLMGPGVKRVATVSEVHSDTTTAVWDDGRTAVIRAARAGCTAYGFVVFCENGVIRRLVSTRFAYRNLCRAIVESFTTGSPAVPPVASLEIVRLLLASLESEQHRGVPVELADVAENH